MKDRSRRIQWSHQLGRMALARMVLGRLTMVLAPQSSQGLQSFHKMVVVRSQLVGRLG
jgi:hypothetical protein